MLRLIAQGKSNKEISEELVLSEKDGQDARLATSCRSFTCRTALRPPCTLCGRRLLTCSWQGLGIAGRARLAAVRTPTILAPDVCGCSFRGEISVCRPIALSGPGVVIITAK